MSPICTIALLVNIFTFSAASTSPSTSIPGSSTAKPKSPLSRITQKSGHFCYSNLDCWESTLGRFSTCVYHSCTCDFGYKKVYPSEKCTKIVCSHDSDCSYIYLHSRCDDTNSCVCKENYKKNRSTTYCVKKGCTYDSDCSGLHTRCDHWNSCVCAYGYSKDSYGFCTEDVSSTFTVWPILLWVGCVLIVLSIKVLIIVLICRRRRRTPRRVIQTPVPTITGVMVSPGTGQYQQPQPGYVGPAYHPTGYHHAPPMYAAPYGNLQSQPQINPQPESTSNAYPTLNIN